jgi:hypothetical protein
LYKASFSESSIIIRFKKILSTIMNFPKIPLILQALLFLIPLNIYVIGDWMGSGIHTLFFRYMQTLMGNSLIFINREYFFTTSGILTGKSAFASILWIIGVALICIATVLVVYAYFLNDPAYLRYCSVVNLGGAILFTLSILIQYGLTLNGPAGIAIPFGIPVILGVAWYQYKIAAEEMAAADEEEDCGMGEDVEDDPAESNPAESNPAEADPAQDAPENN